MPTRWELGWIAQCALACVALRWLFGGEAWLAVEALAIGAAAPWLARVAWRGGTDRGA
jgi:hypothetical protein